MGKDTDGTNWITVRYYMDIDVMAETNDEAFYHASLKLADYKVEDFYVEILDDDDVFVLTKRTQGEDN
jgi:hypothetical protein